VLRAYYEEEVSAFAETLGNLAQGRYDCSIDEIPVSSIQCIERLGDSGFVVYVADSKSDYYAGQRGRAYLVACYDAANRIGVDFTRLFVVDGYDSLTQGLLELMREHVVRGVRVLVAERKELEGMVPSDVALDFGLFDNLLLMKFSKEEGRSAHLEVHYDDSEVARYREIRHRLERLRSHDQFLRDLYTPVNAAIWPEILAKSLTLEVPYGLSERDAGIIVSEAIGTEDCHGARILVLGLTPVLINAFADRGAEVWCADQANMAPKGVESDKHITANWLEFQTTQRFDAIVSDEGLNNLSLVQLRPFFQNMHQHLEQGGRLVMRVMCRVPGWETWSSVSSAHALAAVRDLGTSIGNIQLASKMLRFLHSQEFGFSPHSCTIDPAVWNEKVEKWARESYITGVVAEKWQFPYVLRLISPTLNVLSEIPRGLFVVRGFLPVDESYCPPGGELHPFYRIAAWMKA
jgi:SAM-dependent methyltransferase